MLTDRQRFKARALLDQGVRQFFQQQGYLEVDTPVLVASPGTERHLRYFASDWLDYQSVSHRCWLRSSPELHMKRALACGLDAIFQIAPCFRNCGEFADWHHPEFKMLEWYKSGCTSDSYIEQCEALLHATLKALSLHFTCSLELPAHPVRLTVQEAFREFAGLDLVDNDTELAAKARSVGCLSPSFDDDFETTFFKVLLEKVEPRLKDLTWVMLYDYPPSQAALARVKDGWAKRFEFYVNGIELSNGFWELVDLDENQRRIAATNVARAKDGIEVTQEDPFFYAALSAGVPECFGNALGLDRWLALALGASSLDPVLPFRGDVRASYAAAGSGSREHSVRLSR